MIEVRVEQQQFANTRPSLDLGGGQRQLAICKITPVYIEITPVEAITRVSSNVLLTTITATQVSMDTSTLTTQPS